jgi:hypothetical protein
MFRDFALQIDQNLAGLRPLRGTDDALLLQLIHETCGSVIADPQTPL